MLAWHGAPRWLGWLLHLGDAIGAVARVLAWPWRG